VTGFCYPEVGGTRPGGRPPVTGYHHLRVTTGLGVGGAVFAAAGAAVLEWRMHRALGVLRLTATAPRAAEGVRVVVSLGVGPLRVTAPCAVVWAVEEARLAGFGYGTLPGHPECGEEAFTVEWRADDTVVLTVSAFSRPTAWYARAGGPLTRLGQWLYAGRCGRVLRRLAARR
jgi:uncharacterized protein (UPF0548 family)